MIKLLIVDDHQLMRMGLRKLLSDIEGIEIIAEADSGEHALQVILENKQNLPDVVLMEIKMPGIGGLEATRRLLRIAPQLKIIAVTSCYEEPYPSRMLQAGALGYLTKACDFNELVSAIHKVYSGKSYISTQVAHQLAMKQVADEQKTPFEQLSERELQVMYMITKGDKVLDISEKLCLSTKTVNTYRYRLFEKLHINNDVELTHLAIRHGLIERDVLETDS